jgi:hypothetical protein
VKFFDVRNQRDRKILLNIRLVSHAFNNAVYIGLKMYTIEYRERMSLLQDVI